MCPRDDKFLRTFMTERERERERGRVLANNNTSGKYYTRFIDFKYCQDKTNSSSLVKRAILHFLEFNTQGCTNISYTHIHTFNSVIAN